MQRNTPVRLTSIVRCQSASVCSVNGFGAGEMPALLHRAVEAAEPLDRERDHRADCGVVGDVGFHRRAADRFGGRGRGRAIDVGDDHLVAPRREARARSPSRYRDARRR